ncbi:MAG: hypothetical protein GEU92_19015 [Alphaproteobacteria bacterium]|nr:hypothetical protein [Alphaproteobacteria bacterium]
MRIAVLVALLLVAGCGVREARMQGWQNTANAVCSDLQGKPGHRQCLYQVYNRQQDRHSAAFNRRMDNYADFLEKQHENRRQRY